MLKRYMRQGSTSNLYFKSVTSFLFVILVQKPMPDDSAQHFIDYKQHKTKLCSTHGARTLRGGVFYLRFKAVESSLTCLLVVTLHLSLCT